MNHYSPVVAAFVTMLLITTLLSKFGKIIQDIPNERSLHSAPTPRTGGIGLLTGVLSGWALMFNSLVWWLLLPLIMLFAISVLDDIYNLPVKKRLLVQVIAAAILVAGSEMITRGGIVVALALLLCTVWMTNLYNFMDGSDGLAGGMALFGFCTYGIAALINHNETLAMLNFSISAAAIGFLYFNLPPARVFMGDAGSIPLGFLVAAMGLWGWLEGCWSAWFPLMVFSPFIVDASVTLMKRALRGVKVTEAHREHYYQRAIQLGWSHRKVMLAEYALMLGCGLSALFALDQGFLVQMALVWAVAYTALMLSLDAAWRKSERRRHA